jgi:hypothetical protein
VFLDSIKDPVTSLLIDETVVRIAVDETNREIRWEEVTEIVETEAFFITVVGKVPAACLPKKAFSDEQIEEIRGLDED